MQTLWNKTLWMKWNTVNNDLPNSVNHFFDKLCEQSANTVKQQCSEKHTDHTSNGPKSYLWKSVKQTLTLWNKTLWMKWNTVNNDLPNSVNHVFDKLREQSANTAKQQCSEKVNSGKCPDLEDEILTKIIFQKLVQNDLQKKSQKMSINISLHKSARAWVKRRGCKICTYRLKHAKQTANNTNSHHCMHDCDRSSCVQLHGHALVMIWSRAMASWFSYKFI